MLARRVLSALATVEEAEARLTAVRDGRRPAVFDQSYYEDEVGRAGFGPANREVPGEPADGGGDRSLGAAPV